MFAFNLVEISIIFGLLVPYEAFETTVLSQLCRPSNNQDVFHSLSLRIATERYYTDIIIPEQTRKLNLSLHVLAFHSTRPVDFKSLSLFRCPG